MTGAFRCVNVQEVNSCRMRGPHCQELYHTQRLVSALRPLQKMPSKIMAFFRHPECRYAAA